MRNQWLFFLWCLLAGGSRSCVQASAVVHFRHVRKHKSSQSSNVSLGRRRSKLSGSHSKVLGVARKETKVAATSTVEPEFLQEPREVSFDDLGPIGKVVAATTELGVAIAWNYCQGYLTGFLAGTVLGLPGFVFRPVEPGVSRAFMAEVQGRFVRMNSRSLRFGKSFGGISAIFKGSDVAVRRLRYGKNDEWNDIFGSAIAGAIFAREGESWKKGTILNIWNHAIQARVKRTICSNMSLWFRCRYVW